MGPALADAVMGLSHNNLPVLESNARNVRSVLAPMNMRPLAVTSEGPIEGTPMVNGSLEAIDNGPLSLPLPSGLDQSTFLVRRSIALNLDHGGCWQGTSRGERKGGSIPA